MRFLLLCLALIFAACTPTQVADLPTLRGPIVPTRVIPSATPTLPATMTPTASDTPTLTPTFTATEVPPTATLTLTPTLTPSDTPSPTTTPSLIPSPTDTVETPIPSPTNTVETPTPSPTNTVETPTPSPTNTPDFVPVNYRFSTWQEPVEIVGVINLAAPISGTIDDDTPAALYSFDGTAGMTIDLSMTTQSGDLDPYLLILDTKGREVVRNDDLDSAQRDSAVLGVILPETGTYTVVATRFGQHFGRSSGDFELTMTEASGERAGTFSRQTSYDALISETINDDNPEQIYTFRATAGEVISIQMNTTSGELDPNLTLTDNLGTVLAYNDDNLLIGSLDSSIQSYVIPRSGYYAIVARRFGGSENSGDYRLKLALNDQDAASRYAIINPVNSASVNDDTGLFSNFSLGDEVDPESGEEHTFQVLLTFYLPPNADHAVEEALLGMVPCFERGGGFAELGTLTIYEDHYGVITETRNITRPLPGARILNTQENCDALDLTDLVQEAYDSGETAVQLRLVFRDHENNDTTDSVLITPNLLITFGE